MSPLKIFCCLCIFPALLLSSCSSTKKILTEIPSGDLAEINEDFDPLSLGEPEFVIATGQTSAEISSSSVTTQQVTAPDSAEAAAEVYGYRVQIAATIDEEMAREMRKEAILKFDEEVYWVYDRPYFKIRVGDCESRFEAEDLQTQAIDRGFLEAWVIRTIITPRKDEERKELK